MSNYIGVNPPNFGYNVTTGSIFNTTLFICPTDPNISYIVPSTNSTLFSGNTKTTLNLNTTGIFYNGMYDFPNTTPYTCAPTAYDITRLPASNRDKVLQPISLLNRYSILSDQITNLQGYMTNIMNDSNNASSNYLQSLTSLNQYTNPTNGLISLANVQLANASLALNQAISAANFTLSNVSTVLSNIQISLVNVNTQLTNITNILNTTSTTGLDFSRNNYIAMMDSVSNIVAPRYSNGLNNVSGNYLPPNPSFTPYSNQGKMVVLSDKNSSLLTSNVANVLNPNEKNAGINTIYGMFQNNFTPLSLYSANSSVLNATNLILPNSLKITFNGMLSVNSAGVINNICNITTVYSITNGFVANVPYKYLTSTSNRTQNLRLGTTSTTGVVEFSYIETNKNYLAGINVPPGIITNTANIAGISINDLCVDKKSGNIYFITSNNKLHMCNYTNMTNVTSIDLTNMCKASSSISGITTLEPIKISMDPVTEFLYIIYSDRSAYCVNYYYKTGAVSANLLTFNTRASPYSIPVQTSPSPASLISTSIPGFSVSDIIFDNNGQMYVADQSNTLYVSFPTNPKNNATLAQTSYTLYNILINTSSDPITYKFNPANNLCSLNRNTKQFIVYNTPKSPIISSPPVLTSNVINPSIVSCGSMNGLASTFSYVGNKWSQGNVNISGVGMYSLNTIATNGSIWVAGGSHSASSGATLPIVVSTDGRNFTNTGLTFNVPIPGGGSVPRICTSIIFTGKVFLGTCYYTISSGVKYGVETFYSYDGLSWVYRSIDYSFAGNDAVDLGTTTSPNFNPNVSLKSNGYYAILTFGSRTPVVNNRHLNLVKFPQPGNPWVDSGYSSGAVEWNGNQWIHVFWDNSIRVYNDVNPNSTNYMILTNTTLPTSWASAFIQYTGNAYYLRFNNSANVYIMQVNGTVSTSSNFGGNLIPNTSNTIRGTTTYGFGFGSGRTTSVIYSQNTKLLSLDNVRIWYLPSGDYFTTNILPGAPMDSSFININPGFTSSDMQWNGMPIDVLDFDFI